MNINDIFAIANVIFMFGSIPQIYAVYVDRDVIKGYSLYGSILTAIGMAVIYATYILIQAYTATLFATPQLVYWVYVSSVLIRNRWRKK